MYAIINSTTKKISKNYAVVDGAIRKVAAIYGVIDGVTKLIWKEDAISYPFTGIAAVNITDGYACKMEYQGSSLSFGDYTVYSTDATTSGKNNMNSSFIYSNDGKILIAAPNPNQCTASDVWCYGLYRYDEETKKLKPRNAWLFVHNPYIYSLSYEMLMPGGGYITNDCKWFLSIISFRNLDINAFSDILEILSENITSYCGSKQYFTGLTLAVFDIYSDENNMILKGLFTLDPYRSSTSSSSESYWGNFYSYAYYRTALPINTTSSINIKWGEGAFTIYQLQKYDSEGNSSLCTPASFIYSIDNPLLAPTKTSYTQPYVYGSNNDVQVFYTRRNGNYILTVCYDSDDDEYDNYFYYYNKETKSFTQIPNMVLYDDATTDQALYHMIFDPYRNLLLCSHGTSIIVYSIKDDATFTKICSRSLSTSGYYFFGITKSGIIGLTRGTSTGFAKYRELYLMQLTYNESDGNCSCGYLSVSPSAPNDNETTFYCHAENSVVFSDPDNM